ncbi:MAG: hypothetical protein M3Z37_07345, partial [Candidatus Eremiobacteraeota bacterium]|nr:hypothetical protein [Candidatus Eremiobacteraeota bacterium]
ATARACGLEAREVMEDAPICVLAGFASPLVLVSTGALLALSDAELRAALYHERAHAQRGDQLLAGVLSFVVDLLPLPANDLIQTYHSARELAADGAAARAVGAEHLAGALLQFAKAGSALAGVASLVDNRPKCVRNRLQALLAQPASVREANGLRRVVIAALLSVIAFGGMVAPLVAHRPPSACAITMSAQR